MVIMVVCTAQVLAVIFDGRLRARGGGKKKNVKLLFPLRPACRSPTALKIRVIKVEASLTVTTFAWIIPKGFRFPSELISRLQTSPIYPLLTPFPGAYLCRSPPFYCT